VLPKTRAVPRVGYCARYVVSPSFDWFLSFKYQGRIEFMTVAQPETLNFECETGNYHTFARLAAYVAIPED